MNPGDEVYIKAVILKIPKGDRTLFNVKTDSGYSLWLPGEELVSDTLVTDKKGNSEK